LIVSAQLTAHSMLRRDGTEMVSTIEPAAQMGRWAAAAAK
jgi:hypothetical protein